MSAPSPAPPEPQAYSPDTPGQIENVVVFETEALARAMIDDEREERDEPQSSPPSPPPQGQKSARHRRRTSHAEPDPQAVSWVSQQFLASKPVICNDPEFLATVVLDLENQRDELMLKGDFRESMEAQKAVDTARAQQLDSVKKRNQAEVLAEIHAKQASVQEEYDQFLRAMKEQQQDFENRVQEQLKETEARHQQEVNEHDSDWQSEPKQRQFNRSSQQLRVLRVQQQLLLSGRRYDEAAQVCKIADGLAARETAASHRQMLISFLQSRALLEQKHSDNIDTLMKAVETRRGELQHTLEIGSRRFTNRMTNLKAEEAVAQDAERLWVLRHRNDGDQVVNCTGATARSVKLPPKTADVSTFNTLPLPRLTIPQSPRKNGRT
jgi:hypothetical protein